MPGPDQRRLRRRAHGDVGDGHGDDGFGRSPPVRIARTEAAEQAVASPLLEDINLADARGVLVNITARQSLKMKEVHEVMNTIKAFTADDATVIVGTVIDEALGDGLRVTMVATGLGSRCPRASRRSR